MEAYLYILAGLSLILFAFFSLRRLFRPRTQFVEPKHRNPDKHDPTVSQFVEPVRFQEKFNNAKDIGDVLDQ